MIQSAHDLAHDALQFREIHQQTNVIQLRSFERDAHAVIMPVHVFTLAPVSAQRVTGGKCFFYADFKHGSSNCARKDSAYLLSFEEARSVSRTMRNTVVRQRFQENFTIGHALDAGV